MENIKVTLPDGSSKQLPKGSTGADLALAIGPGLAKDAVAIEINNEQKDLSDLLEDNDSVSIITIKSDDGLEIMRHTIAAQVLASAIKNLYPEAKLAIGPTIEQGFYYDFLPTKPVSIDDLPKIEKEMKKILSTKSPIKKLIIQKVMQFHYLIIKMRLLKLKLFQILIKQKTFKFTHKKSQGL